MRRLLVAPGRAVKVGEPLVESEDVTLNAALDGSRGRVAELEAKLAAERFNDRVRAELTATELGQAKAELASETRHAARLIARSRAEGAFAVPKPAGPGLGATCAKVSSSAMCCQPGSRIVRATIGQDDIDLVRTKLRGVTVKLAERPDEPLPARIIREVPAGQGELPSKALGAAGGGVVAVDPRDTREGSDSLHRMFQVDVELPPDAPSEAFGSRARMCGSGTAGSRSGHGSTGVFASSCYRVCRPEMGVALVPLRPHDRDRPPCPARRHRRRPIRNGPGPKTNRFDPEQLAALSARAETKAFFHPGAVHRLAPVCRCC